MLSLFLFVFVCHKTCHGLAVCVCVRLPPQASYLVHELAVYCSLRHLRFLALCMNLLCLL